MGADAFPFYKSHSFPGYGVCSSQISLLAKSASLIHLVYFLLLDCYCLLQVISSSWNGTFSLPLKFYFFSKTHLHCWHCPHPPILTDHIFPQTLALICSVPNHISFGLCVHGLGHICWGWYKTNEKGSVKREGRWSRWQSWVAPVAMKEGK